MLRTYFFVLAIAKVTLSQNEPIWPAEQFLQTLPPFKPPPPLTFDQGIQLLNIFLPKISAEVSTTTTQAKEMTQNLTDRQSVLCQSCGLEFMTLKQTIVQKNTVSLGNLGARLKRSICEETNKFIVDGTTGPSNPTLVKRLDCEQYEEQTIQ